MLWTGRDRQDAPRGASLGGGLHRLRRRSLAACPTTDDGTPAGRGRAGGRPRWPPANQAQTAAAPCATAQRQSNRRRRGGVGSAASASAAESSWPDDCWPSAAGPRQQTDVGSPTTSRAEPASATVQGRSPAKGDPLSSCACRPSQFLEVRTGGSRTIPGGGVPAEGDAALTRAVGHAGRGGRWPPSSLSSPGAAAVRRGVLADADRRGRPRSGGRGLADRQGSAGGSDAGVDHRSPERHASIGCRARSGSSSNAQPSSARSFSSRRSARSSASGR